MKCAKLLVLVVLIPLWSGGCSYDVLEKVQTVDQKFYETMKLDVAVGQQSVLLWQKTEDARYSLEKSVVNADIDRFLDSFDEDGRLVAMVDGEKKPISKAEVKRIFAERDRRYAECLAHHSTNATAITNFQQTLANRNALLDVWYDKKAEWTEKEKSLAFASNSLIQALISAGASAGVIALAGGL